MVVVVVVLMMSACCAMFDVRFAVCGICLDYKHICGDSHDHVVIARPRPYFIETRSRSFKPTFRECCRGSWNQNTATRWRESFYGGGIWRVRENIEDTGFRGVLPVRHGSTTGGTEVPGKSNASGASDAAAIAVAIAVVVAVAASYICCYRIPLIIS